MVGTKQNLKRVSLKKPQQITLEGQKLAAYVDSTDQVHLVRDACQHRGASLSLNGTVDGSCVRCGYHDRKFDPNKPANADLVRPVVVQNDIVWASSTTQVYPSAPPPTCKEFSEPMYRTIDYSRRLPLNGILMVENTLDHSHLAHVHRVHFVDVANPHVAVKQTGEHGRAEYTYDSKLGPVVVVNEYWAPYTTSLTFLIPKNPPLRLWFSVAPIDKDEVILHLRISRAVLTWLPFLTDGIFKLIDELPLLEDALIVKNVTTEGWSSNQLDASDEFVKAYRQSMLENFPDILAYLLT